MIWLRVFIHDWGLSTDGSVRSQARAACPNLSVPEGADRKVVGELMDLFEAQLIRFSRLLGLKQAAVRPGAGRIYGSSAFKSARVNNWTWQLDVGSLAT